MEVDSDQSEFEQLLSNKSDNTTFTGLTPDTKSTPVYSNLSTKSDLSGLSSVLPISIIQIIRGITRERQSERTVAMTLFRTENLSLLKIIVQKNGWRSFTSFDISSEILSALSDPGTNF